MASTHNFGIGTAAPTGTGAPVRAGSPTFTGIPLAPTIGLSNLTDLKVPKHVDDATGLADTTITVSANNEVTNASQPAFQVVPTATQSNIAINTDVTIVFGTEVFDQNSDFAANVFTAPVTGKYQFNVLIKLNDGDSAATYYSLTLSTSNRSYIDYFYSSIILSGDGVIEMKLSVLADMDATDTAYLSVFQVAGTQQTDISTDSSFSGFLAN